MKRNLANFEKFSLFLDNGFTKLYLPGSVLIKVYQSQ